MARIRSIKPELPQSADRLRINSRGHFVKKTVPASVRRALATRYGCAPGNTVPAKCEYCDFVGSIDWIVQPTDRGAGWVAFGGLEIEHVIAEVAGGATEIGNLTLACLPCNRSKGKKLQADWSKNA